MAPTTFLNPQLCFDTRKPFYALVLAAVAQTHGLIELASRPYSAGHTKLVGTQKNIAPLSGKPAVNVDLVVLASVVARDLPRALSAFDRMTAGSLLVLAWETTEAMRPAIRMDAGPLWEFLRHCRNAAAHDGRFRFENNEPQYLAEWQGHQIAPTLEGHELFADPPEPGYMGPGDVLYLLSHIEARLIPLPPVP